jgi:hypothetical protein
MISDYCRYIPVTFSSSNAKICDMYATIAVFTSKFCLLQKVSNPSSPGFVAFLLPWSSLLGALGQYKTIINMV